MTISTTPALFTSTKIGNVTLKHRVAMAPLTRFRAPNHIPTESSAKYYGQRAIRPGTLLVTEATLIAAKAGGFDNVPGIWSPEQIDGWTKVTSKVHANGSFLFLQLWALGRVAVAGVLEKEGVTTGVVSASDVATEETGTTPRPLSKEEIEEYVQLFVQGAKNAIEAGADGVEIHNANGYLLDQFLHEKTNHRTDEYGGSIENRARFTLEVVDALIDAVGADRVAIRFSPWSTYGELETDISPIPQWSYVVSELEKRAKQGKRLAYIHLIEPRLHGDTEVATSDTNEFARSIWQGIIVRAGGLTNDALEAAEQDPKTVVALGRYFISNPDIVDRLEKKIELTPYNRSTFYASDPNDVVGYTDYTSFTAI